MQDKKLSNSRQILPKNQRSGLRAVRESEPNLKLDYLLQDVTKMKQEYQAKRNKNKKPVRMSQIQTGNTFDFLSNEDKKLNKKLSSYGFLSPTHSKISEQGKTLKKSLSTAYIQGDIASPYKLINKKINNPQQIVQARRSPIKTKKQSLYVIEEMLASHALELGSTKVKAKKSPRFSQPLLQDFQFKLSGGSTNSQLRQNQRKKVVQIPEQVQNEKKQLKQTMSTQSSYNKNMKQLKISDFQLGKSLGKGKFGQVILARHKKTGMIFSIKVIKKSVIRKEKILDQLINQIKIQKFLNHSHIIKLYSIFDDAENIYLLLQLCTQGNLYQQMQQKKPRMSEEQSKLIIKSVCQAVSQLHKYRIIHRDIKPQNIVMCFGMAKICDFGWSTDMKDSMRQTFCGTPLYVSPQLLSGRFYDQKVDLWALGILGYQMMTGDIPFNIKKQQDLTKIIKTKIQFPRYLSPLAVSFLKQLLEKQPKNRKDIQQIIQHPFLIAKPIKNPE